MKKRTGETCELRLSVQQRVSPVYSFAQILCLFEAAQLIEQTDLEYAVVSFEIVVLV